MRVPRSVCDPMIEPQSKSMFAEPRFVDALEDCFFYHTMDLPGLGVMHGHWDLRGRFDDYLGGVSVAGKSVMDIGTATGFLSFESEKHDASKVVSFDLSDPRQQTFIPFKDKLYYRDYESFMSYHAVEVDRWKNAYWLCHRLLQSKSNDFYGDIDRLPKETMVIVTPVLQTEERIARLEPTADNPDYDYTWWRYSVGSYREILKILGFSIARITESQYRYDYGDR